jgi:hypothetical protein
MSTASRSFISGISLTVALEPASRTGAADAVGEDPVLVGRLAARVAGVEREAGGDEEPDDADEGDPDAVQLHGYSSHSRRMQVATWTVAAAISANAAGPGSSSSVEQSRAR